MENICIFGNVITLQIILRNSNLGNKDLNNKLQAPSIKYG